MDKDYLKGIKIGFGILTIFGLLFGIVYAVGFHTANEIISGTFLGNYIFTNNVTFNGEANFNNATVNGISGGNSTNDIINVFASLGSESFSFRKIENGFVDAFNDQSGVDNSSSINISYDSTGDYYWNFGGYTADLIPTMTSATSPSGTASASYTEASYYPWKAFDKNTGGLKYWSNYNNGLLGWLAYEFATPKTITKYTITANHNANTAPKDWTFEGWTGSAWVVLHTVTGEPILAVNTNKSFTFSNSMAYIKYRINMMAGHTSYYAIDELAMMENIPYSNLTIISNPITATSTPTSTNIIIKEEDVDVITLNTDLMAYASRDNGTTWSQGTLTVATNLSTGRILSSTIDLSSQPSGTLMRYKLITNNSKSLKIHGVGMTWS